MIMKKALLLTMALGAFVTFNQVEAQSRDYRRDPYAHEEWGNQSQQRERSRYGDHHDRYDRRRYANRHDREWREQMQRRRELQERWERQEAKRYRRWMKHHGWAHY